MTILFILLGLILLFKVIIPFFNFTKSEHKSAFQSIPKEVQILILEEDVFEIAALVTDLELKGQYTLGSQILDACSHKGFAFANRVDKIRNEIRIKVGLGNLKHF